MLTSVCNGQAGREFFSSHYNFIFQFERMVPHRFSFFVVFQCQFQSGRVISLFSIAFDYYKYKETTKLKI